MKQPGDSAPSAGAGISGKSSPRCVNNESEIVPPGKWPHRRREVRENAMGLMPHDSRIPEVAPFLMTPASAFGKPVCRLGLASHVQAALTPDDVLHALDCGVNFLNWAG